MVFCTTGCNTLMLNEYIRGHESQEKIYARDNVVAIALSKDENKKNEVIFIGERFNYPIKQGGDKIDKMYELKENYLPQLIITDMDRFNIGKTRTDFTADIRFKYGERKIDKATENILVKNQFDCYGFGENTGPCYRSVNSLKGTIQKKEKIQGNIVISNFDKPYAVNFYKKNGLSAARALYPLAVVADIVTSPVQLLVVASHYWR